MLTEAVYRALNYSIYVCISNVILFIYFFYYVSISASFTNDHFLTILTNPQRMQTKFHRISSLIIACITVPTKTAVGIFPSKNNILQNVSFIYLNHQTLVISRSSLILKKNDYEISLSLFKFTNSKIRKCILHLSFSLNKKTRS